MPLLDLIKEKLGDDVDLSAFQEAFESEANTFADKKVNGLTQKRDQLLEQVKNLKKNQLPDGVDIDAYNTFLTEKEELAAQKAKAEEDALAAAGQWDKLKGDMTTTHTQEVNTLKDQYSSEIKTLKASLDHELITNALMTEINAENGNATLLLPHLTPHLKTIQGENGKYGTQVVDAEGNARVNPSNGEAFGIKDLVAEFKTNEIFAGAFPMQNSGSGNNPNGGGQGTFGQVNPWVAKTKNVTMQAKIMREKPELALQLKKQAGVK